MQRLIGILLVSAAACLTSSVSAFSVPSSPTQQQQQQHYPIRSTILDGKRRPLARLQHASQRALFSPRPASPLPPLSSVTSHHDQDHPFRQPRPRAASLVVLSSLSKSLWRLLWWPLATLYSKIIARRWLARSDSRSSSSSSSSAACWHQLVWSPKQRCYELRRGLAAMTLLGVVWWGGLSTPPPAHAASTTATTATTKVVPAALPQRLWSAKSLDFMVDDYVRQHMFDNDSRDPIASVYREAVDDATVGTYPRALKDVVTSVVGKGAAVTTAEGSGGGSSSGIFLLRKIVRGVQKVTSWSEMTAMFAVIASLVVAIPSTFVVGAVAVGSISKRNVYRQMRERYGDDFTVDATIKVDDDVEAPDDDEDDDDEDDDDDDDE